MKSVCKIAIIAAMCFGFVQVHTMMEPYNDESWEDRAAQGATDLSENRPGRASRALGTVRSGAGRLRKSAGEKASSIKSSLSLSDVKNGIKVKLVKVNREERKKLWSCKVPRKNNEFKIINFYRDATITLDPEIESQELTVYEGSDATDSELASISVTIENKKIKGANIKTQVLAVSNSLIEIGTLEFPTGMRWISKSDAAALIAKQRELALVGVARDVRQAPAAAAQAVGRGAKAVAQGVQAGAVAVAEGAKAGAIFVAKNVRSAASAVARAASNLGDLIARLGSAITGPIGEMAKSIATFAKLLVTGGDDNLLNALGQQRLLAIHKNLTTLGRHLQDEDVQKINYEIEENSGASALQAMLTLKKVRKLDGLFASCVNTLTAIRAGLQEVGSYPQSIALVDETIPAFAALRDGMKNAGHEFAAAAGSLYANLPTVNAKLTQLSLTFRDEFSAARNAQQSAEGSEMEVKSRASFSQVEL